MPLLFLKTCTSGAVIKGVISDTRLAVRLASVCWINTPGSSEALGPAGSSAWEQPGGELPPVTRDRDDTRTTEGFPGPRRPGGAHLCSLPTGKPPPTVGGSFR